MLSDEECSGDGIQPCSTAPDDREARGGFGQHKQTSDFLALLKSLREIELNPIGPRFFRLTTCLDSLDSGIEDA